MPSTGALKHSAYRNDGLKTRGAARKKNMDCIPINKLFSLKNSILFWKQQELNQVSKTSKSVLEETTVACQATR